MVLTHWLAQEQQTTHKVTHNSREVELVQKAEALWEADKTQEAIEVMHQIVALRPDSNNLVGICKRALSSVLLLIERGSTAFIVTRLGVLVRRETG